MRRSHRSWWERLICAAAYRCERCQQRMRISYLAVAREARHANCPKCGWNDLTVRSRPDRIDKINRNPLRLLQCLLGARLYHCSHCRLQFYDVRGLRPGMRERSAGANRMVESESES